MQNQATAESAEYCLLGQLYFVLKLTMHIEPILEELHWLPVNERILFKVLLLDYKCKKGLAPEYLRSLCILYKKNFNSRSNNLDLLDPWPKTRKKTYGYYSFKVAGAEEYKLPLDLKKSPSVVTFKKNFKTHFIPAVF